MTTSILNICGLLHIHFFKIGEKIKVVEFAPVVIVTVPRVLAAPTSFILNVTTRKLAAIFQFAQKQLQAYLACSTCMLRKQPVPCANIFRLEKNTDYHQLHVLI